MKIKMTIKFSCNKHCLDFEKTYEELQQEKVITHCPYCGQKLRIQNINEIINTEIKQKVENYVTQAYKKLGLEGTLEAIEHLQNKTVKQYYQNEIRKRGLIK